MAGNGKKRSERAQRSLSWRFFKPVSKGIAKCFICRRILSYKSSTSNLKRHLLLVHGGVYEEMLQMLPQNRTEDDINVVSLINCVKMFPCLWDTRCSTYGDSQLQHNAWNNIAVKLKPREDLNLVVTNISDQFNMLRNTFFSARQSLYHEELSFLKALLNTQEHTVQEDMLIPEVMIKVESGDQDEYAAVNGDVVVNEGTLQQSQCLMNQSAKDRDTNNDTNEISSNHRRKGVGNRSIQQTTDPVQPTSSYTECTLQLNKVDSETFFLLSLANEMKRVPRERQMDFRRDILSLFSDVIKKYENQ